MEYPAPLVEAQFIKRYKRFFADVRLSSGELAVAHVPNTGSLRGICDSLVARPCRLLKSNDPKRKLAYTLEQVCVDDVWVGVNTHRANELAWAAFVDKALAHWGPFVDGAREVKISDESRLDLRLNDKTGACHFVEVKSVTLARPSVSNKKRGPMVALFPDSETTRGQKHLRDLMRLQKSPGTSTEILFVIQRADCAAFSPAEDIDPEYARLLREAQKAGVRISVYPVQLEATAAKLMGTGPLEIQL